MGGTVVAVGGWGVEVGGAMVEVGGADVGPGAGMVAAGAWVAAAAGAAGGALPVQAARRALERAMSASRSLPHRGASSGPPAPRSFRTPPSFRSARGTRPCSFPTFASARNHPSSLDSMRGESTSRPAVRGLGRSSFPGFTADRNSAATCREHPVGGNNAGTSRRRTTRRALGTLRDVVM